MVRCDDGVTEQLTVHARSTLVFSLVGIVAFFWLQKDDEKYSWS